MNNRNLIMSSPKRPMNEHDKYHAHVYFDASTLEVAEKLCQQIGDNFSLKVRQIHQNPIGPHTMGSFQVLFTNLDFDFFIPWLDQYRGELSVLVHADTGDNLADHTKYAYWLGEEVKLDLRRF